MPSPRVQMIRYISEPILCPYIDLNSGIGNQLGQIMRDIKAVGLTLGGFDQTKIAIIWKVRMADCHELVVNHGESVVITRNYVEPQGEHVHVTILNTTAITKCNEVSSSLNRVNDEPVNHDLISCDPSEAIPYCQRNR